MGQEWILSDDELLDLRNEMIEEFREIEGYPDYQVSSFGRVKNNRQDKVLRQCEDTDGYLQVGLCNDGKRSTHRVHRLVAKAFLKNPKNKPCVDHINQKKEDNHVLNLRYVTHKENNQNKSNSLVKVKIVRVLTIPIGWTRD